MIEAFAEVSTWYTPSPDIYLSVFPDDLMNPVKFTNLLKRKTKTRIGGRAGKAEFFVGCVLVL